MKTSLGKKNEGSVLLVATLFIVVVGLVLASYLKLLTNESYIVSRSQSWNQCIPVMEAGVEEAMAEIHSTYGTLDYLSNSWTAGTNGYYQKTRTVGTDGSYYVVSIQPVVPPVIYSVAYVPVPGSTNYIAREVRVTTQTLINANGGVMVKGTLTIGGGGTIDSYDSSQGPYNPLTAGTNVMALTDSTNAGAVTLSGTMTLTGIAVTGPGGTVTVNGGATVGGIDNDANVEIDDINLPNTTGWQTSYSTGTLGGTTNQYSAIFYSGNYALGGSFSPSTMAVSGNVNLYIPTDFSIGSMGSIYLTPNSTLTVYVGKSMTFGASSTVNNGGVPSNVIFYGLPSCTAVNFKSKATLTGQIDAPEASLVMAGQNVVYGALIANSVKVTGGASVHYDRQLAGTKNYIMSSWNEL